MFVDNTIDFKQIQQKNPQNVYSVPKRKTTIDVL